jgi:hypothetical protein
MEEGAGGNCPPHFEKLMVAKLIPPHLALKLRERKKKAFLLQYGSIYVVQLAKDIRMRVCFETIMTFFFLLPHSFE